MDLQLAVYDALCETRVFTINSIEAEYDDFGSKYDHNSDNAEAYACGDMRFERHPVKDDVLKKYKITPDEYETICDKLEELLSFGCCGWCV